MHVCIAKVFFGKGDVVKYISVMIFLKGDRVLEIELLKPNEQRQRKLISYTFGKIQDYIGGTD